MHMRPMDTRLKTQMSPHLGLYAIASVLEPQHEVVIFNENLTPLPPTIKADLVGITVTVDTLPRAIELAAHYRSKGIPVIAGGIHISACPDSCQPYFDAICIGPSEGLWPGILSDLQDGALQPRYTCSSAMKGSDIASPAYHLIKKSNYLYSNVVFTSYGCPFRCDFCYNSCAAYQGIFLNKPVAQVVSEIQKINKKHILFIDDNFIGSPAWARDMVQAMLPLNIKWNAAVSANILDMPDLLDAMARSGCQGLFIGFESLTAAALANVHKGQNQVERYEALISEIHKRGMMVNASFVFGLDGDDATVFQTTVDWIIKNKIETVTSHILTPYPGTQLYDSLLAQGRITSFDYSKYNTAHVVFEPLAMSQQQLYSGYLDVYRQVYSLKNIIRRRPKSRRQIIPFLLFNLFYRKFGKVTDALCRLISYERLGIWAEKLSRYF